MLNFTFQSSEVSTFWCVSKFLKRKYNTGQVPYWLLSVYLPNSHIALQIYICNDTKKKQKRSYIEIKLKTHTMGFYKGDYHK